MATRSKRDSAIVELKDRSQSARQDPRQVERHLHERDGNRGRRVLGAAGNADLQIPEPVRARSDPDSGVLRRRRIRQPEHSASYCGPRSREQGRLRQIGEMVGLIEREVSDTVAESDIADTNQQFQQYILAHGMTDLARNVTVSVLHRRNVRDSQ